MSDTTDCPECTCSPDGRHSATPSNPDYCEWCSTMMPATESAMLVDPGASEPRPTDHGEPDAEVTALRARVREMEGALMRVVQVADNAARAFPDEVQQKDEYRRGQVRGAMDAARPARAMLPAPAPGHGGEG